MLPFPILQPLAKYIKSSYIFFVNQIDFLNLTGCGPAPAWHGETSTVRKLNGGGPQGATFGIWEYLAQSNNSADCVDSDRRFKFVDDLTVLEKINLLIVGLSSFYSKATVPNDVAEHNQIIPAEFLN